MRIDQIDESMQLRKKHNGIEGITKAKVEKFKMPVYRAKPLKTKLPGDLSIDLMRLDPKLVAVAKSEKFNKVDNNVYGNASGSFTVPESKPVVIKQRGASLSRFATPNKSVPILDINQIRS